VDESGQHDPENATIIGPIVPTGGIDDGTAPLPIEDIAAWDTPDDEGGRINVSWTANLEDDCSWYTIYATPVVSDTPPDWADDADVASIVVPCLQRNSDNFTVEVIMDEIAGAYLIDLMPYWITVVASDNWGNVDHWNVTWVQAFSVQNTIGVDPPPRVEDLQAWDHSDDDGTAIDVQWAPTTVNDFAFYVVWASEHPLENVAIKWMECEENPADCGLLVIQQQRQSWSGPINIVLESALYGGNSVSEASASDIIPNQPIWVTVTIHDIKGNAFLTNLGEHMTMVTPIDNSGDVIAPDRLPEPLVVDRQDDSGDALLVTFEESDASDLDQYEIYADTIPFTDVGSRSPAMIVERDGSTQFQPGGPGSDARPGGGRQADSGSGWIQDIVLNRLSNGQNIQPGTMVWVAVVPVDTSGNAWTSELNVATATPIDDSQTDPGLHLPEITGISATWNEDRDEITVEWDESNDPQVVGYIVNLNPEFYEDVRSAFYQFDMVQGTRSTISPMPLPTQDTNRPAAFDVNGSWYVSVVAYDGEVTRFGVTPVEVQNWTSSTQGIEDANVEDSGEWWNELSPMEMALMAVLTLMILLLSMIIIGRLRKPSFDPLDHATPNWELQVEDWGGDNYATTMEPEINFGDTLVPAATTIRDTSSPPTIKTPSTTSIDDLESLAGDLLDEPESKDSVDTSFLDDLL
jgi:hypothetical protein